MKLQKHTFAPTLDSITTDLDTSKLESFTLLTKLWPNITLFPQHLKDAIPDNVSFNNTPFWFYLFTSTLTNYQVAISRHQDNFFGIDHVKFLIGSFLKTLNSLGTISICSADSSASFPFLEFAKVKSTVTYFVIQDTSTVSTEYIANSYIALVPTQLQEALSRFSFDPLGVLNE